MQDDHRLIGSRRRIADLAATRWKNGRGETRVLAESANWRASVATIVDDSDFSIFEGCSRASILLEGPGLELRSRDQTLHLTPGQLVHYDGSMQWRAIVPGPPVRLLNIIHAEKASVAMQLKRSVRWGQSNAWLMCPVRSTCWMRCTTGEQFKLGAGEFIAGGALRGALNPIGGITALGIGHGALVLCVGSPGELHQTD